MDKRVAGFTWRFLVLFALVLIPWPGWREAYGIYFRGLGDLVYSHHSLVWTAYFEPHLRTKGYASMDSQIVLYGNSKADENGHFQIDQLGLDSRSIGWIPTGLTLALILAVPMRPNRRIISALIGFFTIQVYILFVMGVYILNRLPEAGITTFPIWVEYVTGALEYTFVAQLGPAFVVPVIVALLSCKSHGLLQSSKFRIETARQDTNRPIKRRRKQTQNDS